jgi:uncharacterized protein YjbI with pentapeptide repeats
MRLSSSTPTRPTAQRNGAIDPDALLKACDTLVQKTPELLEVCKQAQDAGGNMLKDGLPQGLKDAKDMLSFVLTTIVSVVGLNYAIRTNGFTTFANSLSKKKLKHIAAQNEPSTEDLKTNDEVYQICEAWENGGATPRPSQLKLVTKQIETCFRAMWEGETSRKKGGTSPTDDALNLFGIEITGLIAPYRLQKITERLQDGLLMKSINYPWMFKPQYGVFINRLTDIRNRRAILKTPAERANFDKKYPHLVRLNGKGGRFNNTKWVDCDVAGFNLDRAYLQHAELIGTNIRFGNARRLNAQHSKWIVSNADSLQGRGMHGQHSEWFETDARFSDFRPAMANGLPGTPHHYYRRADFTGMQVQELNFNPTADQWVKASKNDFSHIQAQGAIFDHSEWNNMDVSYSHFERFDPKPSKTVTEQTGYSDRRSLLTPTPIWETLKDEDVSTRFDGAIWRNVILKHAYFEGAKMTNMRFPCEMETVDAVCPPARRYNWRGQRVQGVIPKRDARNQHPYMKLTNPICFTDADLKHTDWAGSCLNAVNKMNNNAIESRLRFEGADLSGADFTNAWLLHPVTGEHLGMRIAVQQCIAPSRGLNATQKDEQKALLKHMADIFGSALYEKQVKEKTGRVTHIPIQTPVQTSVDKNEMKQFAKKVESTLKTKKGN